MALGHGLQFSPARAAHDFLHRGGALAIVHGNGHDIVRIPGQHLLLADGRPALHIGKGVFKPAHGCQLIHEGSAARRPQPPLQGGYLKVHGFAALPAGSGDVVKGGLHVRHHRFGLHVPAHHRADHADGGIHARDVLGAADHHLHAVFLQLLHLLLALGHVAHEHHLGRQGKDFLHVGFRAGLHHRHGQNRLGIVAVFAAAHQRVRAPQGAEDFAVGGGQRHHSGCRAVKGDFPSVHVGDAGVLRHREGRAKRQQQDKDKRDGFPEHFGFLLIP